MILARFVGKDVLAGGWIEKRGSETLEPGESTGTVLYCTVLHEKESLADDKTAGRSAVWC